MQIKNIIFDWSKVCTVEGMSDSISRYLSKKLDLEKDIVKKSLKKVEDDYVTGKITGNEFLHNLLLDLNLAADMGSIQDALIAEPQINEEVFTIIQKLKSKYRLILFSDNFKEMSEYVTKKYKLHELFETIVLSNKIGLRKPDKKIYEKLIELTGIKPDESLFIDDREKNLEIAREFKFITLLFISSDQLKNDLKKMNVL